MKIDKIYCINLDRRPDRWETASKFFAEQGLKVERWSAVDGQTLDFNYEVNKPYRGEFGGLLSHYNVIVNAYENNYENVLIFEDDVYSEYNILSKLDELFIDKSIEFDMLYLGGNHIGGLTQINQFLFKMNRSYAIQAYILNKKAFYPIIEYFTSIIPKILNSDKMIGPSVAADYFLADLHKQMNCYVIKPHITYQLSDFSDIQQTVVDYKFLKG